MQSIGEGQSNQASYRMSIGASVSLWPLCLSSPQRHRHELICLGGLHVTDGFAKVGDRGWGAVDHDGRFDHEFFRVDPV